MKKDKMLLEQVKGMIDATKTVTDRIESYNHNETFFLEYFLRDDTNIEEKVYLLFLRGLSNLITSKYSDAEMYYKLAIDYATDSNDTELISLSMIGLLSVYERTKNWDAMDKHIKKLESSIPIENTVQRNKLIEYKTVLSRHISNNTNEHWFDQLKP